MFNVITISHVTMSLICFYWCEINFYGLKSLPWPLNIRETSMLFRVDVATFAVDALTVEKIFPIIFCSLCNEYCVII